jgi:DeoR family glycerol-3-phosphate regulon repressor
MKYSAAAMRLDAIVSVLDNSGFATIANLALTVGVSEMTIRRDLRQLHKDGRIRLVHGGAYARERSGQVSALEQRRQLNQAAKSAIGGMAADLIRPNDSIAIDAGTTTLAILEHVPESFAGTIISHSIPVLTACLQRKNFRTVGLGGDLFRESGAFVGPRSVEMASSLRVRLFFLGAAAVDTRGVYVSADLERGTKTALMEAADLVILLADHSKFQSSAPVLLCKLDKIDMLLTDLPLPPKMAKAIRAAGVKFRTSAA